MSPGKNPEGVSEMKVRSPNQVESADGAWGELLRGAGRPPRPRPSFRRRLRAQVIREATGASAPSRSRYVLAGAIGLVALAALAAVVWRASHSAPPVGGLPPIARPAAFVRHFSGEVSIEGGPRLLGDGAWNGRPVKVGQRVLVGPDGLLVLATSDGSIIALNKSTQMRFTEPTAQGRARLWLARGDCYAKVVPDKGPAEIVTAVGSVSIVGTELDVSVADGNAPTAVVRVIRGAVEVTSGADRRRLSAGEQLQLGPNRLLDVPGAFAPNTKTWYQGMGSLASPMSGAVAYLFHRNAENRSLMTELWTVAPDGSNRRRLFTFLRPISGVGVPWLPGRDALLMPESVFGPTWVVDVGEPRATLFHPLDHYQVPRDWAPSPDGSKIAFRGSKRLGEPAFHEPAPREDGLWVLEFATGQIRRVLGAWPTSGFAWAPDSKHVVVSASQQYDADSALVVVNALSGEVTDLGVKGAEPSWSPDGTLIAYTSGPPDLRPEDRGFFRGIGAYRPLYCLELSSGRVTRLTRRGERGLNPRWSPDGTRVAYLHGPPAGVRSSRDREKAPVQLCVISPGQPRSQVLYRAVGLKSPRFEWLPDGESLAVMTRDSLVVVAADGSGVRHSVSLTAEASPLPEAELKDTRAVADVLRKMRTGTDPEELDVMWRGDLERHRQTAMRTADTLRALPAHYPQAGLIQEDCDFAASFAAKAASISAQEYQREQAGMRLDYIVFLLGRYYDTEGKRYPPDLATLREWALSHEWGMNMLRSTDKEYVRGLFHVPGAPGGWDDVSFVYEPPDPEHGKPGVLEYRHLPDVVIRADLAHTARDEPGFLSAHIEAVPKS